MKYNQDRVDEVVLGLLYLTSFRQAGHTSAWKSHDWDALDRLFSKGLISDPKTKAKSVVLSDEGSRRAEELFAKWFGAVAPIPGTDVSGDR